MRRLAASISITGLALMTSVGVLGCGWFGVTLETRVVLFLSGVALFAAGGAGYNAMEAPVAAGVVRK